MSGNPILRTLAVVASAALLVTALAVPVMAAEKPDCKEGGWQDLHRPDASAFKNQGQCVEYAAQGGTVVPDACTYLNDPALDATYFSHGPVMLRFVGDETVSIAPPTAPDPIDYEASVLGLTVYSVGPSSGATFYVTEPAIGYAYWVASLVAPQWAVDCTH